MDWKKINFNDYKGKPLVYLKKMIKEKDNTKQKIFYKCVDWPTMVHYAKYNLTFTKSEIENYDENILFEHLNMINIIDIKKLIGSYLLIKNFNLTMTSGFLESYNFSKTYINYTIMVECEGKKYKFRHFAADYSVTLSIEGLKSYSSENLEVHIDNNYSFNNLFEIIKNKIIDNDESNSIYDVLFVIDLRLSRLRQAVNKKHM